MKSVNLILVLSLAVFLLAVPAAISQTSQTGAASISGAVLDAKTLKPVPSALVIAVQNAARPLNKNTRSGGDGAFQIQGLPPGSYSLCAQAPGDAYLDPCQWNGTPITVTLVSGQAAVGVSLRLAAASVVTIQVQDPYKLMSQKTRDGRRPDLTLGVWGPKGLYYPAHATGVSSTAASPQSGVDRYSYQVAVPPDTALTLSFASRDVKLGDAVGVALPANASQQVFQYAAGDANPKSFVFTLLGLLP